MNPDLYFISTRELPSLEFALMRVQSVRSCIYRNNVIRGDTVVILLVLGRQLRFDLHECR